MTWKRALGMLPVAAAAGVAAHDLLQRQHALLRNFPVLGSRALPAGDDRAGAAAVRRRRTTTPSVRSAGTSGVGSTPRPSWRTTTSASAPTTTWSTPRATPSSSTARSPTSCRRSDPHAGVEADVPSAKVLGRSSRPGAAVPARFDRQRLGDELRLALRAAAIEALNRGAAEAGCLQNTGEGGLSPYHRHGADLVFQIGTAYFGCRDAHGRFDLERLKELVAGAPVRALEIKLSQGAKPGLGGLLPGPKVTPQIAEIRGIEPRRRLREPVAARRVRRRGQHAGLGGAPRRRDRSAGRHQVCRRRPDLLGGPRRADGRRSRRRLRDDRRRRRAAPVRRR